MAKVLVAYVIDTDAGQMSAPEALTMGGADLFVIPLDATGTRWAANTAGDDAVAFDFSHRDMMLIAIGLTVRAELAKGLP
jgi:hypothetical protein